MSNTVIQLKFSTVAANVPSTLANGELAINSADGKLYYSTPGGSVTYLNATYPAGLTSEIQFNDAGSMGSNSGFTFSKSNQLLTVAGSANIGGMNVVPTITSAYAFANTVNIKVDSAYAWANTVNIKVDSAYTFANAVNIKTDSAYAWANTVNIKTDAAYTKANSANILAQAAFDKANSVSGSGGIVSNTSIAENIYTANGSQTVFTLASAATQDTVLVFVSGVLQPSSYYTIVGTNTTITLADAPAANDIVVVKKFTGAATDLSNASFDKANSANILAQAAFSKANSSNVIAQGAYDKANVANSIAQAAFDYANNSGGTYATAAFAKANAANVLAQSAYDNSNTKFASAGGTISGDVTLTGNLIPTTDNVYYLGSTTKRWRSIFVGANSIDVGGIVISNSGGSASLAGATDFALPDSPVPSLGTLSNTANAAFAQANTANVTAEAAYAWANTINIFTQSAFTKANTANVTAEAAYAWANTVNVFTQASYAKANAANVLAQAAFDNSNTKFASAGGTITGNVTISNGKDLTVTGNLYIQGNTVSLNTSTLDVVDTMITLGAGNYTTDLLDIGFAGHYNAGTNAHTGLIRDSGTKEWYFFKGYTPELSGNNNINLNDATFATDNVNAGYFKGNLIGSTVVTSNFVQFSDGTKQYTANAGSGASATANAAYDFANTVNVKVDSAYAFANTVNIKTDAAFTKANNALANTTGTFAGTLSVTETLKSLQSTGDEGGQIDLATAATNQSLVGGFVNIDIYQNKLRIFESGGTNRGVYVDIANGASAGVGTNLLAPSSSTDGYARTTANAAFDKANAANILAQSAFTKANDSSVIAQAAFDSANISSGTYATAAFAKANAANVLAQAAFDKANTGSGGSGNANTSGWLANTVIFANAGGYLSNTNNLQFFSSNNVLQVTTLTTVGTSGNITNVNYISANGITTTGSSGNISGVNFIYANNYIANTGGYFQFADGTKQYTANADSGAYAFANTVNIKVDSAYAFANIANIKVDSAYAFANTVNIKTDAAFTKANSANVIAQGAYDKANSANVIAQGGYDKANAANVLAQAAFNAANSSSGAAAAFDFANTVNVKVDSAYAFANTVNIKTDAAFTKANSANVLAQAAFNAANSAGGSASQAAFDKANSANVLAQAAFDKANTGGGGGSSGNTSITENTFTANGSQTSFTLSTTVTQDAILVAVNGVLQENAAYTVVGSNTIITLSEAPSANDVVIVKKFTGGGGGSSSGGASVSISDAPPTSPTANSLWWQSNTGILKIYYTDADSSQWVDASPPSGGSSTTDVLSPFLLMGA